MVFSSFSAEPNLKSDLCQTETKESFQFTLNCSDFAEATKSYFCLLENRRAHNYLKPQQITVWIQAEQINVTL